MNVTTLILLGLLLMLSIVSGFGIWYAGRNKQKLEHLEEHQKTIQDVEAKERVLNDQLERKLEEINSKPLAEPTLEEMKAFIERNK